MIFLVRSELRQAASRLDGRRRRALALALLLVGLTPATPAPAQESARCADLRAQIARAGADATARRYRAAAEKLRAEYAKLSARGRSMGCDREPFLIFGDPPPPQCGPLIARINALRGNIEANERAASDDSQRQALSARYDAECRNSARRGGSGQAPKNFFEELFGLDSSEMPPEQQNQTLIDAGIPPEPVIDDEQDGGRLGGSTAICVRDCDGGFFPAGFYANSSNLDELDGLCKALCPNASVKLYTRSQWRGLDDAKSIEGARYAEHPNAFKFQTSYDPSCGCKPPGKSWTEALADAEAILAERYAKDRLVTVEQAEEMSRPLKAGEVRASKRPPRPGAPSATPTETPAVRFDNGSDDRAVYKDVTGSDGVTRRVRVIAPTM